MDDKQDNPFGTEHRHQVIKHLMDRGLIKRITIIEGNYPTKQEQRNFLDRTLDWLKGKPMRF